MADGTRKKLSVDLDLACDIYSLEAAGKRIWYTKLVQRHEGKYTKQEISRALDTLFDWGIVFGEYGETEKGRGGRLLLIDDDHIDRVAALYRDFYTPPPGAEPGEADWPRHLESRK
jgi:hypothetical protein